ncbi:MAG TPA: hypothetical protein PK347_01525 [Burkholderiaceae bacterium]|mgnify:CR=1 FL=1|nr:hypothetical protein [Burkholderiaceae bacterium]
MTDKQNAAWVLHVCPPNGGGVDRFVRDVCGLRKQDWVVHVSDGQCVLEHPGGGHMVALTWDQVRQFIEADAMGLPAVIHAHSSEPDIRRFCALWKRAVARVVTLHDIGFTGPQDKPTQRNERQRFLQEAKAMTVPSDYIAVLLHNTPGLDGLDCQLIENGTDSYSEEVRPNKLPAGLVCPVAVVGAIGRHKGWARLEAVVSAMPETLPLVLLGYAEQRLTQGWLVPGKLWVHGAFQLEELPSLVKHYGVRMAFFPPGQPESYCYALSDAWLASVPALVPNLGALGERVNKHAGGEVYDAASRPEHLAVRLQAMVKDVTNDYGVKRAIASIPSVEEMVTALEHIYIRHSPPERTPQPQLQTLQAAAVHHLDSAFFRRELVNLSGQLAQLTRERDAALSELRQLSQTQDERMHWLAHLEQDIENLNQQVRTLQQAGVLAEQRFSAEKEELIQTQEELTRVQAASVRMTQRIEKLLSWLPSGVSRRILQRLTR